MGKKKQETDRDGESALECGHCGCGILPDEPTVSQSMSGRFGGMVQIWHADKSHCVSALREKVAGLEGLVVRQAKRLDRQLTAGATP